MTNTIIKYAILWGLFLSNSSLATSQVVLARRNTTAVVTDKSRMSSGASAVAFNSRPTMPTDERDKPVSTLEATTDLEGTLYLNEKPYPITEGSLVKIPVPKSYSYYFVTKDTLFTTTEVRQSLKAHELKTPVKLNMTLREEYSRVQSDKVKSSKIGFILRGVRDSMRLIKGGQLPAVGRRAEQRVNDFEIMSHEVTVTEFEAFVEDSKKIPIADDKECYVFPLSPNSLQGREKRKGVNWSCDPIGRQRLMENYGHPVINVSWFEAVEFCNWLTSKDKNYNYRLPTAAEWEFAAGCGEKAYLYPWHTEGSISDFANTADAALLHQLPNLKKGDNTLLDDYPFTAPVCSFAPNCFQLYDMAGNVAEWVEDFYFSEKTNPNNKEQKMYKGGSYFTSAAGCAILNNTGLDGQMRHSGIGFRVCRVRK